MATRTRPSPTARAVAAPRGSITVPGIMLGLGLGGFVDGILLHQILQWHHMRSGDGAGGEQSLRTVGGLEANTLADGLFHTATWLLVVGGLFLLWNRARRSGALPPVAELAGLMLVGWGLFNVIEGLINHQMLGIHHVRDDLGAPLAWDLGFLGSGIALIVAGWLIARTARRGEGRPGRA